MTIRLKLNLAVAALIAVFLGSAGFALLAVSRNSSNTHLYSRMRELGRLTSDIRTDIYHRLSYKASGLSLPNEPSSIGWPDYVLDDIDVQIRLATSLPEQSNWKALRASIQRLDTLFESSGTELEEELRVAERHLRKLRSLYDSSEYDAIAAAASTSFVAQVAIAAAGVVTVVLFLIYLIMVRDWLVRPIDLLKQSADTLGQGFLQHRVPLQGDDELSLLARRIDLMAHRLSAHQKALVESRELSAIGELCTNVAHGLRNPLASLRASAQFAGRRAGDPEETKLAMMEIIRQVDRLDERITRLFEYSRPTHPVHACTTFADLCGVAQREVSSLLKSKNLTLQVEDETDGTYWCLDGIMIGEVIGELLANAAHHSASGTWIRIRGRVDAQDGTPQLLLEVVDCGSGMGAETMGKAFDLFFTNRESGSGMGLGVARRAVERHGGQITLQSEPDRGTTVRLIIPKQCPHDFTTLPRGELPDDEACTHCMGLFSVAGRASQTAM